MAEELFRTHTEAEADALLSGRELSAALPVPAPWLFSRVLGYGLLAGALLMWALNTFANPKLIPGELFFFCVTVPVATLVFLIELCGLARLSAYRLLKAFLLGGVFSLVLALIFFAVPVVGAAELLVSAMIAGPVEETAKLLAAVLVSLSWKNCTRLRDGLLIGAAVGTGFAVFETAGYIFEALLNEIDYAYTTGFFDGTQLGVAVILRAILSPFCHVIWTAIAAAALWRATGGRPKSLTWERAREGGFARLFTLVIVLHMLWNSGLRIPVLDTLLGGLGMFLVLGFIGWYTLLQLYREGRRAERGS
jgi:RsiW-degrading membrane proteinase PrsW (M82 family)